jgi:hypothetical protein
VSPGAEAQKKMSGGGREDGWFEGVTGKRKKTLSADGV